MTTHPVPADHRATPRTVSNCSCAACREERNESMSEGQVQTSRYFGWSDYDAMVADFMRGEFDYELGEYKTIQKPEGFPEDKDVVFAAYDTPAYEGSALVVYRNGDNLFEVNASHCSCYGLEDQWRPEETTMEALQKREFYTRAFLSTGDDDGAEARVAWHQFTGVDLDEAYEQEQAKWN